jgi:hypothetical protein
MHQKDLFKSLRYPWFRQPDSVSAEAEFRQELEQVYASCLTHYIEEGELPKGIQERLEHQAKSLGLRRNRAEQLEASFLLALKEYCKTVEQVYYKYVQSDGQLFSVGYVELEQASNLLVSQQRLTLGILEAVQDYIGDRTHRELQIYRQQVERMYYPHLERLLRVREDAWLFSLEGCNTLMRVWEDLNLIPATEEKISKSHQKLNHAWRDLGLTPVADVLEKNRCALDLDWLSRSIAPETAYAIESEVCGAIWNYYQKVRTHLRGHQVSSVGSKILKRSWRRMGIGLEETATDVKDAISRPLKADCEHDAERLKRHRQNVLEYNKVLAEVIQCEGVPKEKTIAELKEWQQLLGLDDKDIPAVDEVLSARGVDYTHLWRYLHENRLQKAAKETVACMLKAAGHKEQSWLSRWDIEHFPCTDLATIDMLWKKVGNGKFGFSVQQQLWNQVEGNSDAFGDRVGWRGNNTWLSYEFVLASLDAIDEADLRPGYLPIIPVAGWWFWMGGFTSLLSRLSICSNSLLESHRTNSNNLTDPPDDPFWNPQTGKGSLSTPFGFSQN